MVGAQKGAPRSIVCIFLLFFIVLNDDLSPAFAPHRMQIESLKGGFFCVWDPLVTYLSRYFNSLRANQFQPIANEKCWYRRWYFRFDINLY